jgi:uncharacterized protein
VVVIIKAPVQVGKVTTTILELINKHEEVWTLWELTNVMAQDRLRMTDHGAKHFQIVLNNGLTMLDILHNKGIETEMEKRHKLGFDYAQAVVVLASLFHDLGMSIHRENHEEYSLFLANDLLRDLLSFLPVRERVILKSDVLHAIISHRSEGKPLTIEAGVVKVADALDMTEGRSRFTGATKEELSIHSVSAQAIDVIEIVEGEEKPIRINVVMNHTAGIFQTDELFKRKVDRSGIEKLLDVEIYIDKGQGRQLFKKFIKG